MHRKDSTDLDLDSAGDGVEEVEDVGAVEEVNVGAPTEDSDGTGMEEDVEDVVGKIKM